MTLLLTDDDLRKLLADKLQDHSEHWGTFFLPTVEFYDSLGNDAGLQRAAKELFRWVGVKPRSVHVHYGHVSEGYVEQDANTITITQNFQHFPFQSGAALALAVSRHIMSLQTPEALDSMQLVEGGSVQLGFGLVVLNGVQQPRPLLQKIYHALHQQWHLDRSLSLQHYRNEDYAACITDYALAYRLSADTWLRYVQPKTRNLLNAGRLHSPFVWPTQERSHQRAAHRWWLHFTLLALLCAGTATLVLYVWAQRIPTPSTYRQNQLQHIEILYNSYTTCQNAARTQENAQAEGDIYTLQNLNTTKNRCQSLKNQYNAAVAEYNESRE